MSRDWFYRPILSADISAINLAVELALISPRKSGDKIGWFYRSSVIGYRDRNIKVNNVFGWVLMNFLHKYLTSEMNLFLEKWYI